MSSVCTSSCVEDAVRFPARASYRSVYKWPESDAEFVRSVSNGGRRVKEPGVVDSISCRQMYLRSYSFSRKESMGEKTKKCLGRIKERVIIVVAHQCNAIDDHHENHNKKKKKNGKKKKNKKRKRRSSSFAGFWSVFHRVLSCTTKVDVVDGHA